ncbi:hypothetical protein FZEAL_8991 [Fusarium zealandicum]|uniref:Uncharacterized protein n=1 Tax=Fusarium zealandicum TaxID=1053134 RepID=A0A8H4UDD4_9HYPO|nr:hypothetical protein FZEAL_8991 [Fusarium zealandicum]
MKPEIVLQRAFAAGLRSWLPKLTPAIVKPTRVGPRSVRQSPMISCRHLGRIAAKHPSTSSRLPIPFEESPPNVACDRVRHDPGCSSKLRVLSPYHDHVGLPRSFEARSMQGSQLSLETSTEILEALSAGTPSGYDSNLREKPRLLSFWEKYRHPMNSLSTGLDESRLDSDVDRLSGLAAAR